MFRLLSTAACALVAAAPGWADAQEAPPKEQQTLEEQQRIENPERKAARDAARADRREVRDKRNEARRAQPAQGKDADAAAAAPEREPARAATAERDRADQPAASAERGEPDAATDRAGRSAERQTARPERERPTAPAPDTTAETAGAPAAIEQRERRPLRDARRQAGDDAPAQRSATTQPSPAPTPTETAGEGDTADAAATNRDNGTTPAETAEGAPPSATSEAPAAQQAPAVADTEQPAPTESATEPQPPAQAATQPEAQQPAQNAAEAPAQQQVQTDGEPDDEDGVSSNEFWTGAGLALAPWVLQGILQGQGNQQSALAPVPQGQSPYPQQGAVYPYVFDPQTGRYYDQRTGRIVEETTIVERGRGAASSGGGQARRGRETGAQTAFVPQTNIPAEPDVLALADWNYDDLYRSGWRADHLLGTPVQSQDGQAVGEVRNILIGQENQIAGLLVEVAELGRTGETVAAIPWDQVRISAGGKAVTVPVTPGNLRQFSMFQSDNIGNLLQSAVGWLAPAGGQQQSRTWKVTDLLDDYVTLAGGQAYGYVHDVVFDPQGRLQAVLVYRDIGLGGGAVAYPFTAYGFEPWAPYYAVPYQQNEVANLPPFETERLD